ncbi:cytochrome C oxidase subunit IV family protein [Bradyrhizobium sp. HKCCYLRH2060]|uniref:cytochrome C oxidase subunit IV family protein n=1 Tax=Bradyrhizobium TaxID=374 RepID=UPI0029161EED|nr:cytochrome C oxidase subunit IV family protein [Bradyrhizobium sp. SZCCHNR3003]
MNPQQGRLPTAGTWWRRNGLIWLALMLLLFSSTAIAYVPMGRLTTTAGIVIAVIKSGLVMLFFMELTKSKPLIRLAAVAGLVFVAVLFTLTFADVLTRPG